MMPLRVRIHMNHIAQATAVPGSISGSCYTLTHKQLAAHNQLYHIL
jgi:hypothetical protein